MSLRSTLERRLEEAQWFYAIGKQNLNTDWQLRKVASVGARPRVLGRPRIEATDLVVGDDFSVWSAHRQTLVTGWGRIRVGDRCFINSGVVVFSACEVTLGDDEIHDGASGATQSSNVAAGRPSRAGPRPLE